ncbi:helix-turn-helix domain-containing protein [Porticoccus sp. GXU_MW_L64]
MKTDFNKKNAKFGKKTPHLNPGVAIGAQIKSRRKELGLTLQALAEASGLSAPFLSQAERGLTTPSMVSLLGLAKALDVPFTYFVEVPHDQQIVHRAKQPVAIDMDSPVSYTQLGAGMRDQQLDAILMEIPPGHEFPVDQREGEDFLYLISGELYCEVGETKTLLKAGDSMHFKSRIPHTAINKSKRKARLLYVGTPSFM